MLAARSELSEATTVSELVRMNEHMGEAAGRETEERGTSMRHQSAQGDKHGTGKREGEGRQGEDPGSKELQVAEAVRKGRARGNGMGGRGAMSKIQEQQESD